MSECTCNQAIPRSEIGQMVYWDPAQKKHVGLRFDQKCPVHRIVSAVNGVPTEPRQKEEKVVDKPLTAREKRVKARKAKRA